jgi:hypothetical protein
MLAPHPTQGPAVSVPQLLADDLPPGYRFAEATPSLAANSTSCTGARSRSCWRWVPSTGVPTADPLAVDAAVTEFDRRAAALQAVNATPELPDGLTVRRLYPPRIGDETAAVRADVTESGTHYVLYRVDVQVGRRLATVAAAWRWPGGSPSWVYERARRLAGRLAKAD